MQLSEVLRDHADGLVEVLSSYPSKTIISIQGDIGLGKTSLLYDLNRRLAHDFLPVFVSPPSRAVDTGPAVIMQVTDAFRKYGLLNGDGEAIADPSVDLKSKLELLGEVVSQHRNRLVLLCDEPREWLKADFDDVDDQYVQCRKERIVRELCRWKCRRVFAGALPDFIPESAITPHKLPFDCVRAHEQPGGELQDIAATLIRRLGPNLAVATALARRLLMAFAKATSIDAAVEFYGEWPGTWFLAQKLSEVISDNGELAPVRDIWARLALFRGPLSADLLDLIGVNRLNPDHRAIVYDGLLQQADGNFLMHDMLKQLKVVSHWQEPIRRAAHEVFADYFKSQLSDKKNAGSRLELTLEGFHHSTLAEQYDARDVFGISSIEQLHVLGRVLSKQLHDHAGAAKVFAEVVRLDPLDDYGHHYWAYNLDWDAADEMLAEHEYERAVNLNPEHPWWWSRWINFLITTGKLARARREWNRANTALAVSECSANDRVWWALHLWIARLLLHRGQLEFARYVLGDVHDEVRKKDAQFIALDHLLQFLDQAEDEESVFPWCVAPSEWWTKPYPHLTFDLEVDGMPLRRWYPARVIEVDKESVWLIAAKKPEFPDESPTYGRVSIPRSEFDTACSDTSSSAVGPDRYLELAFYGDEDILRIRCYPSSVQMDNNLPGFDPPNPRRYLNGGDI